MVFLPGLELARRFHDEAVRPILERRGVPYSAALLGRGSEVLGFDTERSTDHDWGPRLQVFVTEPAGLDELLSRELPREFLGYSTHFAGNPVDAIRRRAPADGPVRHAVEVADVDRFFGAYLGFVPTVPISRADWLATPTQTLAELTSGGVFHDGLGRLEPVRAALAWYPDDVWREVLAGQWQRVAQEEPFVGRCGEAGDELGSAVVAARLVRDLMRLCLLMARRYPPYSKWLGSAFARLPIAPTLTPHLTGALAATTWPTRETHLADAYETVAAHHNQLGLTPPLEPRTRGFHSRPYRVLDAARFADALCPGAVGAVDQWVDSTDVLGRPERARAVARGLAEPVPQHEKAPAPEARGLLRE
ncbi:DUF4037 domain-containing protein [Amycolatopsis sp. FDAARGOS 1241]|uniref:DUF4037 domain-containing protein n=1 Tax=Amycolatopsis sp. FDAARGOS 1241 TaxID=2778070 RepID=UPI0019502632|nr:DUF4037 domain-containing protein [Amycolatopsis sp. FDAARGOS 1241]QRP44105.1 DUF4037 domain-containing protein [Amycolatopsis sp. FDAARGOS 1241]